MKSNGNIIDIEKIIEFHNITEIYHGTDSSILIQKDNIIKSGLSNDLEDYPSHNELVYFSINKNHNEWYREKIKFFNTTYKLNISDKLEFLQSNLTIDEDIIFDFFCWNKQVKTVSNEEHPLYPGHKMPYITYQRILPSITDLKNNKTNILNNINKREKNNCIQLITDNYDDLYNIIINIFEELDVQEKIIISEKGANCPIIKNNYLKILMKLQDKNNSNLTELKLKSLFYYKSPSIAIYGNIDLKNWKYEVINH